MTDTSSTNQVDEGISGYWINAAAGERCSVCFRKDGQVLRLTFSGNTLRLCPDCGVAMCDLLIDALEDIE